MWRSAKIICLTDGEGFFNNKKSLIEILFICYFYTKKIDFHQLYDLFGREVKCFSVLLGFFFKL